MEKPNFSVNADGFAAGYFGSLAIIQAISIPTVPMTQAVLHAADIYQSAVPVIRIHSIGGQHWKRNVAKGARIGPWRQAKYEILDAEAWNARTPCLYLVAGEDGVIRYVGISRNRMKDRWRVSPAYDAESMSRLSENQLFHSQCWKHIERESGENPTATFEVRCITGDALLPLLERLGPPLSGFVALRGDGEGIVAGVERWLCNNKSERLVSWNVAMTGELRSNRALQPTAYGVG